MTVFADPYLLFTEDSKHSEQEEREWAIGEAENGSTIVVVFTMRGKQIRIISAIKAIYYPSNFPEENQVYILSLIKDNFICGM